MANFVYSQMKMHKSIRNHAQIYTITPVFPSSMSHLPLATLGVTMKASWTMAKM